MKGILYGVGTGPGDPELLTLKALRIIKESDVIVIPGENPADCVSYRTAAAAWPRIAEKELLCLTFPMIRSREKRMACCEKNADIIAGILSEGKQAAFLTIGDPSVYSTYGYLHNILRARGCDVRMVSGVTSFCAAAAELGEILCEDTGTLEIIPSFSAFSGDSRESSGGGCQPFSGASDLLSGTGTKVLMKPGKDWRTVREILRGCGRRSLMAENCGRSGKRLFFRPEDFPDETGYFTVVISKPADASAADVCGGKSRQTDQNENVKRGERA